MAAATPPPRPRVMLLPFPAQGHIMPLMELSHRLVDHGFEVDFVNKDFNHARILRALAAGGETAAAAHAGIDLVSFPDGMGPDGDRTDIIQLGQSLPAAMHGGLEELVRAHKTRWIVADVSMSWVLDMAGKVGVHVALFETFSAATFAVRLRIPKMVEDGIIDENGWPNRQETFQLAPGMPPLHTSQLVWNNAGAPEGQPAIFQLLIQSKKAKDLAEVVVCNSFRDAEPGAFKLYPDILPIGPLFADREFQKPVGQFLPEETGCLEWLDAQADRSIVYVAFGSFTVFNPRQFEELALGLELTGRPFLWVVRPDFASGLSKAWLDEFRDRVGGRAMIVSWCPQQQVLAHRAVACFVSHCGWNSTMEGVRNAVPFLCWPYFTDQFLNESYICNVWRTGLPVALGPDGVVTKEELSSKVDRVLGDDGIRERVSALKDVACRSIADGGSSHDNFKKFVELLKE